MFGGEGTGFEIGGFLGSLLTELQGGIQLGGLFGDIFNKIRPILSMIVHGILGL